MIRVLYDTFLSTQPTNSGIPQDTRLLLKTLSLTPSIEVAALVHTGPFSPEIARLMDEGQTTLAASIIINSMRGGVPDVKPKGLKRLKWKWRRSQRLRSEFNVAHIHHGDLFDSLWRTRLQTSLSASDRDLLRDKGFWVSGISEDLLQRHGGHKSIPKLDTSGFDFLIFQDSRRAECRPGTKTIVRYHDALPVVSPDTFPHSGWIKMHYGAVAGVSDDTYFVCNSELSKDQLLFMFPHLRDRAFVIPYTLPNLDNWRVDDIPISQIVRTRFNDASLNSDDAKRQLPKTIDRELAKGDVRYIVMVSTLEPRKNYVGAVEAFQTFSRQIDGPLKFIIVGRPGWSYEPTLAAMAPGVKAGDIFHLSDLTFPELVNVYKKAEALIFPSYGEGFGFTPMEALMLGTPAIVSDIPVHRWVMGESVMYANPYDSGALVAQLHNLFNNRTTLLDGMKAAAPGILQRYSLETTTRQWHDLLTDLKSR